MNLIYFLSKRSHCCDIAASPLLLRQLDAFSWISGQDITSSVPGLDAPRNCHIGKVSQRDLVASAEHDVSFRHATDRFWTIWHLVPGSILSWAFKWLFPYSLSIDDYRKLFRKFDDFNNTRHLFVCA